MIRGYKAMKNRRYLTLIIVGFVLWIAETAVFGFNDKPESGLERALDFIAFTLMFWGIIGDILSNITVVKKNHYNYNVKTEKVEVVGDNQKVNYNIRKAVVSRGQNDER